MCISSQFIYALYVNICTKKQYNITFEYDFKIILLY